jgi:NADH-quinone oxidoreductase subunit J
MNEIVFAIFALAACGGALAVVLSQNVVRMAFWLIISLSSVAGLFFLLNADFVGATQLLIYVGGTVVLLIFGVMLTAQGPYVNLKTNPAEVVLSLAVGGAVFAMLVAAFSGVNWTGNSQRLAAEFGTATVQTPGYNQQGEGSTVRRIGGALSSLRTESLRDGRAGITRPGYLLPFEIVSVHLLVVLVGASYLARAKRRTAVSQPGAGPSAWTERLPLRRCGAVRVRRRLHGDQTQRHRRADGRVTRAQRGECQLRRAVTLHPAGPRWPDLLDVRDCPGSCGGRRGFGDCPELLQQPSVDRCGPSGRPARVVLDPWDRLPACLAYTRQAGSLSHSHNSPRGRPVS